MSTLNAVADKGKKKSKVVPRHRPLIIKSDKEMQASVRKYLPKGVPPPIFAADIYILESEKEKRLADLQKKAEEKKKAEEEKKAAKEKKAEKEKTK